MTLDRPESGSSVTINDEFVAELTRSHGSQLLQYLARMLGQMEAACEVAEDTYQEIRERYRPQDVVSPRATLYRIATNFAVMRVRCGNSKPPIGTRSVPMELQPRTTEDIGVGSEELYERLEQTIRGLRHRLRTVLVMAHVQGIARKDIADNLGISLKRLDKRMAKALQAVLERMSGFID